MDMYNIKVLIKPDETVQDIIAELCDEADVGPDEHFCFSAIVARDKDDSSLRVLKLNCLAVREENPYSATDVVKDLMCRHNIPSNGIVYKQPPLEQWLTVFRPLLLRMVAKAQPHYEAIIPDRDDLLSILYTTVLSLYNKGYYLHNTLIYKSFVNALNMEYRRLKIYTRTVSLNALIEVDEDSKDVTPGDQIADPSATRFFDNDDEDYWCDKSEQLKARMLQDMSQLQFDRILIQLATNTVDRSTSYKLDKYRQIFNPGYMPRPNAQGKNKGGKKQ